MATTLNSATLADPVACPMRYARAGELVTMGNGARRVRTTVSGGKSRAWTVKWQGITAAEYSTLAGAAAAAMLAPTAFQGPDMASTVNVLVEDALSIDDVAWLDGAWHYDVTLTLVESDPA